MSARRMVIFVVAIALAETLGAQVSPERILNAPKESQNWLTTRAAISASGTAN